MIAMSALTSAPVDVGVLVLVTLLGFGLVRWAIEVHRDGGGTGEHRAPSRRARRVRVIPASRTPGADSEEQCGGTSASAPGLSPTAEPPLEPLLPAPVAAAVAQWETRPVAIVLPWAVSPASPDQLARLAERFRQAQPTAAPPPPAPFTEQLAPSPALIRAHEQLLADAHMPASTSPDWEQRPAVPGYLLDQLGHGGDVDAAVDSMFSRADAAVTRALADALADTDPTDAAAAQIRDGAL